MWNILFLVVKLINNNLCVYHGFSLCISLDFTIRVLLHILNPKMMELHFNEKFQARYKKQLSLVTNETILYNSYLL